MKYPVLLFDADDTLFDFPKASARAFAAMCRADGIPDTEESRQLYHTINLELWAAFDRGEVSKEYVTLERFVRFLRALDLPLDPVKCNRDYLTALGAGVFPLPRAEEVCRELVRRGHRLYIVTNAVASVQRSRLQGSVFADLITDAFISEDAGASKPSALYYEYVLSGHRGLPGHGHPGRQQRGPALLLVQPRRKAPAGGPADRLRDPGPAGAALLCIKRHQTPSHSRLSSPERRLPFSDGRPPCPPGK